MEGESATLAGEKNKKFSGSVGWCLLSKEGGVLKKFCKKKKRILALLNLKGRVQAALCTII